MPPDHENHNEQSSEAAPQPAPMTGEPVTQGSRIQSTNTVSENQGTVIDTNIGTQSIDQAGWDVTGNVTNVAGDQRSTTINYYPHTSTPLDRQQQRNRRAMLAKVKTIWIDGLLNESLVKELRIALDLTTQPDAVQFPLNALVQELRHAPRVLTSGTPIINVFDQMGGALLILGAPGAGKTTLLLELTRDLLLRAEHDEVHPIPILFNLSSWAVQRRPLKEWLVEELNQRYDVPKKIAQGWIDTDALLPLLDGLDEVAVEHQSACVEAINHYRQEEHGLLPLAVCSRMAEYDALAVKLRLRGAILVQPLSQHHITHYLEQTGDMLAGVRAALHDDSELFDLLNTPLMLSIFMLAFAGNADVEIHTTRTPDKWRQHIFDAYITGMFRRRTTIGQYAPYQTIRWLSWLAKRMVAQNQTVYYIERMQPDWLPNHEQHTFTRTQRLAVGLVFGLGSGLLVGLLAGLGSGLFIGLLAGLGGGLFVGLFAGLGFGLIFGWGNRFNRIIITEKLRWFWSSNVLVFGLLIGLGSGLLIGLIFGLLVGLGFGLGSGLLFGLGFGLLAGLSFGLGGAEIEARTTPNQGVRRSARSGLVIGLVIGLGFGLLFGLGFGLLFELFFGLGSGLGSGLFLGLFFGLLFGLGFGLEHGGRAVIQHYLLRWLLSRNGALPFRDHDLIAFLTYCAERIFLRKVGGGYIFVHRLLMDHFASLTEEDQRRIAEGITTIPPQS